jgi:rhodanese-related sulfurtransferase
VSKVTKGYKALVAEAEAQIETISVSAAGAAAEDGALLVDLRDVRELKREGKIPGAVHAPRGMLEFWVDPDSPYHREVLSSADRLILYCNLGWRSALAAKSLQDMGLTNVAHLAGGFDAWKADGGPVEKPPER